MSTKFLSAGFECWNCTNLAPETHGVGFDYIAIEPNQDWHPVCAECAVLEMEVAAGRVEVYRQHEKDKFVLVPKSPPASPKR